MSRRMTPPQIALYNGRNVAPGQWIEVLNRDVESLLGRGWAFGTLDKPPKKPADNKPAKTPKGKK